MVWFVRTFIFVFFTVINQRKYFYSFSEKILIFVYLKNGGLSVKNIFRECNIPVT